ncbi:MAG: TonB-dependent receptor [Chitinophagaceae bacterium]
MKKRLIPMLSLAILFISPVMAQDGGKLSGTVANQNNSSPGSVTASLLKAKDSTLLKLTVTNKEGLYEFENLSGGKYIVLLSGVSYRKTYSQVVIISPEQPVVHLPVITMETVNKDLAGVTVTSARPLIEHRVDRTIVNVDASISNIGTTALEVLEKSPGISVDRDGNISLKGKEGVLVLIDNRPTQLGGADLANLLRSMNSGQMDQVEILTNPPARYDAAGNAGIINIKTKKTNTAGYNGSAAVGFTQGRYPKTNESLNFNYRQGKVNFFSTLSHNYRKGFGLLKIQRKVFNSNTGAVDFLFDQRADRIQEGNSYNAKIGLDFFVNKKTTLGIILNGASSPSESGNKNTIDIKNANSELQSFTKALVEQQNKWKNFSTNINFRRTFNKKGRELTADLDILTYQTDMRQFMANSYFDPAGEELNKADTILGHLPQEIKVYSARLDYIHPLGKDATMEAGFKSSRVNTDIDARYDSIQYGSMLHDINRSNHFIYTENINAAYTNLSLPFSKKWSAQLGLRLENTIAEGRQLATKERFTRNYTQVFPTTFIQYKLNGKNTFSANFGRRIRRPNYGSLNPFVRFIDRYTYTHGNPELKPSFSYNYELSHSWNNQITTTVNYTSSKDLINDVIEQKGDVIFRGPANIASLKQVGLSVNANNPVTKWWTSSVNLDVFNNHFKGNVVGAEVNLSGTSFVLNGTQQFKLSKTLTAELNGRYRSGLVEGVVRSRSVGTLGAGIGKQVMKNKGTVRISIRDIFYSQISRVGSRYGNVDINYQEIGESRVVSVGFNYRFAKGKKIDATKRTAGSANEEQGRVGQ